MKRTHPKVAIVSGFWGQNIGNAFFNIGGKWILEQVFGKENVSFIQDQPAYRTLYNKAKGNPKNYANLLRYLDIDYIVLQGPMLTTTFRAIWEETFKEFKRRNVKIILLGSAFFKYTEEEFEAAYKFLREYPPIIISTRDSVTYNIVKDWDFVPFKYNGIDSAFFVPKAFNPLKFTIDFYVLNYDRFPEPNIFINEKPDKFDRSFEFEGNIWYLQFPKLQEWFSRKGKAVAYIGHLIDRRKLPPNLLGKMIVRPEHRYTPHITWKIYKQPNAVVSDEPFTYFSIYANSKLTLSDRVHACVITLAFGNPAMLYHITPRQALFKRLGLDNINKQPVTLDLKYLEKERNDEINFLKHALTKIN